MLMMISSKPAFFSFSITCCSSGFPPTGTSALGMVSVSGLSRVPIPAAKIIAFIINVESIIITEESLHCSSTPANKLTADRCFLFSLSELLLQVLLPVYQGYSYPEFRRDMFRHLLCRVDRTVLTAGTAE